MTALDHYRFTDPVLRILPTALIDALDLSADNLTIIEPGHHTVEEGSALDAIFLIADGWATSQMKINTGDSQTLDIMGPGTIAGLCRLDDVSLAAYSITILQKIHAYQLNVDALTTACSQDEELSRWLMSLLVRQTQRTQRHLTALGQLPARGRLAFVMLRILAVAQQMGQPTNGQAIPLPMTQDIIGNMLGLTNVSVSKIMTSFRKEGLIDYSRNRFIIKNVAALSDICGMTPEDIPSQLLPIGDDDPARIPAE
jgi:CRP-like cAMP-binding protein